MRYMAWFSLTALLFVAPPCEAAKKWRTYENCVLVSNPANDADSFHVRYNKRRYLFRLYFVDAPESDNSLPERVAEQAAYWGIEPKAAIQLGKEAAKFTEKFLADGFTVHSKLADARGRSEKDRDYAVVLAGDRDLAVELVRNGYARIHGVGIDYPDGTPEKTIWWRLKSAEREAQKNMAGGWGKIEPTGTRFEQLNPEPGPLTEQILPLTRTLTVYSLQDASRMVGYLRSGVDIQVMREESPGWARIRFTTSDGKTYEAQCKRQDLGI